MKLLVTGAAGMLGRDVVLAAGNAGHQVVGFGHAELDVADEAAVAAKFESERPDSVVISVLPAVPYGCSPGKARRRLRRSCAAEGPPSGGREPPIN